MKKDEDLDDDQPTERGDEWRSADEHIREVEQYLERRRAGGIPAVYRIVAILAGLLIIFGVIRFLVRLIA